MKRELPQLVKDFLNHLKVQECSNNTIIGYKQELHDFFLFIIKHKQLNVVISKIDDNMIKEINIRDLNAFIAELSEKESNRGIKYSSATKAKYVACIKSFFKFLEEDIKLIDDSPAEKLKTPKKTKTIAKYLNIDEANKLLDSIEDERNYAMMILFLNCGFRLSELLEIEIDNITSDSYGNKIVVNGKGNKERTIYLNDICMNAIRRYTNIRPECDVKQLFVCEHIKGIYTPMKKDGTQSMVKKYLKSIGIDAHVHSLRHTFASIAVANDVDIQTLQETLGHSNITTTDRYIHNFNGNTSKVAQLVNIGK